MKKILFLCLCLAAKSSFAQSSPRNEAFRAHALCLVAEFIAADNNKHYQPTDFICDSCLTTAAINAKAQALTGFKDKFKAEWADADVNTEVFEAAGATKYVDKLAVMAVDKHEYRKTGEWADAYIRLQSELHTIVAKGLYVSVPASAAANDGAAATETVAPPSFLTTYWAYIMGLLGVLLGAIIGYFLPKGNKNIDPIAMQAQYDSLDDMYKKSMAENQRLQGLMVALTNENKAQFEQLRQAQNDLQILRKQTQTIPAAPPVAVAKPVTAERKLYALYPDRGATGFGAGILSDSINDDALYIITVQADGQTATFSVTNNRAIYQRGLNDFATYFQAVCDFNSLPTANSSITTAAAGQLALRGNVWTVTKKAILVIS
jgi:hypothetical protein